MPEELLKIIKECLLIVEGMDEVHFFNKLLELQGLGNIQIINIEGKDNLNNNVFLIKLMTAFKSTDKDIKAVGIILDCDDNNIQAHINKVNTFVDRVNNHNPKETESKILSFEKINKCNKFTSQKTPLGLYVMPDCNSKGALETLCLKAVKDKKFMPCIENFMKCLENKNPDILSGRKTVDFGSMMNR